MRVLLTGAFGVIGRPTIDALRADGHWVRCFDRSSHGARRAARGLGDGVEVVWGDMRDAVQVAAAVAGAEAIVHLAGVLPPLTERAPALARAINVEGTRALLAAAAAAPAPPVVVFASSVSVFGPAAGREPPRRVSDPVVATDHYTAHKIECEDVLRAAGVPWVVLRIGVALDPARPAGGRAELRLLFDVAATHRLEYVDPRDVARAIASAVACPAARGRVLLLGGGPTCRIRQRDLFAAITDALGLAPLPDAAFGDGDFYTDWMDTAESERLLHYQQHSFDEFRRGLAFHLRHPRRLAWPVRPLVRAALLRLSAPWRRRGTERIRSRRRPTSST